LLKLFCAWGKVPSPRANKALGRKVQTGAMPGMPRKRRRKDQNFSDSSAGVLFLCPHVGTETDSELTGSESHRDERG